MGQFPQVDGMRDGLVSARIQHVCGRRVFLAVEVARDIRSIRHAVVFEEIGTRSLNAEVIIMSGPGSDHVGDRHRHV
jgi:hypothetical protein